MAVSFPTTTYTPSLHHQVKVSNSPPSYSMKQYSGLKPQSFGTFGAKNTNLSVELYREVNKSLRLWAPNHKPSRSVVRMMPIGVPRVPYKTPGEGGWQWVDIWNALYRDRIIFLAQDIDEEFSNQILATMLYLDSVDSSKRIYVYINGHGGDLTPSLALYDTMQSLQSPVGTHCIGMVSNMATFLLAGGEKGKRSAMPLSRIALESIAGSARGQASDIRNETNELLRIKDYLFSELAEKTGQPIEKINEDLSQIRTMRFSAQEAIEYGIIDRIARPPRLQADAYNKSRVTGLG